jgi:lipopolysaccharide transport system ATP-binding protein
MTSDIVIRAEGLGKKYIIGHQSTDRSNTFRDVITQNVKNFVRGAKEMAQGKAIVAGDQLEEFWALKDVNFEIKRGDVVGIIGRNGAGKSTLLKVLSRITEPSEGRVEIKGRVASLLEVGTGFHPELSGRENVYLNGAILGMTRAEINRKFDEIVDFSGVEKFLDTPVKRYSSGMYVRLAFAVAAHLEPEILIVDEVLAVGDAEFQKKCLGKMQDVAGQGRTVLFVSHNMGAVQSLCDVGILMDKGKLGYVGNMQTTISTYRSLSALQSYWSQEVSEPNGFFTPFEFRIDDERKITVKGRLESQRTELTIGIAISTPWLQDIFWTTNRDVCDDVSLDAGVHTFTFTLPQSLAPGSYVAELVVFLHNDRYIIDREGGPRISFEISSNPLGSQFFNTPRPGIITPLIEWHNEQA